MRYIKLVSLLSLMFIMLSNTTIYAQCWRSMGGIGGGRDTYLKRRLAPFVNIKNKQISILAIAQGNTPKEVPEILKTKLVTDVQRDTQFKLNEQRPETILKFTVTAFDIEYYEGYRKSGEQTIKYVLVNGNIEVSYQAIDARNNAPIDSENLTTVFKQDYPPTLNTGVLGKILPTKSSDSSLPPTKSELQNYLINEIVRQMSKRAAPSEETFKVPLPRCKLDTISKIAMAQAWGKVLEGAQTMTPFLKPEDDSYRLYLIGLANEALAYEQTKETLAYDQVKFEKTRTYLFEARKYYEESKTRKPNDDNYIEAWTRVDKALAQYEKITRQKNEYNQYISPGRLQNNQSQPSQVIISPKPVSPPPASQGTSDSDVWDNQMIIKLWKDGTPENELIEIINNAEAHKFDVKSPIAYGQLKDAKVPVSVISAMRKKATPVRRPSTPSRSGSRGTKKP